MKIARLVSMLALALFCAWGAACSKKSGEPPMFTGKVLSRADILGASGQAMMGKFTYAEVNDEWLKWAYADFRSELAEGAYGVVGWDDRSQCTFFATSFEAYSQKRYHAQAWHSRIPAPGVAVGTRWYLPNPDNPQIGHALNVVFTKQGPVNFEPQTGRLVALSDLQKKSTYLQKFD